MRVPGRPYNEVDRGEKCAGGGEMIQHIMLWTYREDAPPEERARIEAELVGLPGRVPSLSRVVYGPVVGGRNQSFSHCFVMYFDNIDGVNEYAEHPAHVAFAGPFREACAVQVVTDFEVQSD